MYVMFHRQCMVVAIGIKLNVYLLEKVRYVHSYMCVHDKILLYALYSIAGSDNFYFMLSAIYLYILINSIQPNIIKTLFECFCMFYI